MNVTAYDIVGYPTTIIPSTRPDGMATIARLHGLTPPAIETARVLELGGGDGMNLIALAVAYPRAHFVSIDLASVPVQRGRTLAAMIGLANVDVRVGDIVAEADTIDGQFDYIIAHGVYAWVPEPVRAGLMRLIGRALAPDGVAYVSYNALPGGHLRQAVRDMALHHIDGIADPVERLRAARAFLADLAMPRDPDVEGMASIRAEAANIAAKRPEVLHHDELGAVFAPQALKDIVAAANARGLAFLNDAQAASLDSGLLLDDPPGDLTDDDNGEPLDEAAMVRRAQTRDYEQMRFFTQTLFVRAGTRPARHVATSPVRDLWIATKAQARGDGAFELPAGSFTIGDDRLSAAVAAAASASPAYVAVADVLDAQDEEQLRALVALFRAGAITLHSAPFPAATTSDRPVGSPLARATIASGQEVVFTLDHAVLHVEDAGARAFLMLLDGTRDRAALAAEWQATSHADAIGADEALRTLARFALIQR